MPQNTNQYGPGNPTKPKRAGNGPGAYNGTQKNQKKSGDPFKDAFGTGGGFGTDPAEYARKEESILQADTRAGELAAGFNSNNAMGLSDGMGNQPGLAGMGSMNALPTGADRLTLHPPQLPSTETFVDPDRGFINKVAGEGDIQPPIYYSGGAAGDMGGANPMGMVAGTGDMAGPGGQEQYPYKPIDWPTDGDGRKLVMDDGRQRRPHNWYGQNPPELYPRPEGGTQPPWSGDPVISGMNSMGSQLGRGPIRAGSWRGMEGMGGGSPTPTPTATPLDDANYGPEWSEQNYSQFDNPTIDMGPDTMETQQDYGQPDMAPYQNDPVASAFGQGFGPEGQAPMQQPEVFPGGPILGKQQGEVGDRPGNPGQIPQGKDTNTWDPFEWAPDTRMGGFSYNDMTNFHDEALELMGDATGLPYGQGDLTPELGNDIQQQIIDSAADKSKNNLVGRSSFAGGQAPAGGDAQAGGDALSNALSGGSPSDFTEAQVAGPNSLPTTSQFNEEVAPSGSESPTIATPPGFDPVNNRVMDDGGGNLEQEQPPVHGDSFSGGSAGSPMDSGLEAEWREQNPGQPLPDQSDDTPDPVKPKFEPSWEGWGSVGPDRKEEYHKQYGKARIDKYVKENNGNSPPFDEWDKEGQDKPADDAGEKTELEPGRNYGTDPDPRAVGPPMVTPAVKPDMVTVNGKQYKKDSDRKEGEYGGFASEYPKGSGNWNVMFIDPPAGWQENKDKPALEEFKDKVDAGEVSDEPKVRPREDARAKAKAEAAERRRLVDGRRRFGQVNIGGKKDGKYYYKMSDIGKPGIPTYGEFADENGRVVSVDPTPEMLEETKKKDEGIAAWSMFHGDLNTRDVEGSKRIQEELGIDKAYGLKMRQVDEESNRGSGPMYAGHKVTTFEGADGRRFERSVWANDNWPGKAEWTEVGKEGPADEGGGNLAAEKVPGTEGMKEVGEKIQYPGSRSETTLKIFEDENGKQWSWDAGWSGDMANEGGLQPYTPDPADKFSEVGDAAYDDEGDGHGEIGYWNEIEGFGGDNRTVQAPEADAGSASPEDLNNPDNWDTSGGGYVYRGAEFGKTNTSAPADTEDWAQTRQAAASRSASVGGELPERGQDQLVGEEERRHLDGGTNLTTPGVIRPPATEDEETIYLGDGKDLSSPEISLPPESGDAIDLSKNKKIERRDRDDYDLAPELSGVPLDVMQDSDGNIDYGGNMLVSNAGGLTKADMRRRGVEPSQIQALVNNQVAQNWGEYNQAVGGTGLQAQQGMSIDTGTESQRKISPLVQSLLGSRKAEIDIPWQYAMQHADQVRNRRELAHQLGLQEAGMTAQDFYADADDRLAREAVDRQLLNSMYNANASSWNA